MGPPVQVKTPVKASGTRPLRRKRTLTELSLRSRNNVIPIVILFWFLVYYGFKVELTLQ